MSEERSEVHGADVDVDLRRLRELLAFLKSRPAFDKAMERISERVESEWGLSPEQCAAALRFGNAVSLYREAQRRVFVTLDDQDQHLAARAIAEWADALRGLLALLPPRLKEEIQQILHGVGIGQEQLTEERGA